ncbi:MAG: sensor histidine kinase [Ktedonobacteraceae bacterium]|nr:sensor histidine kinase [Ktedonobacteraceae bacterium]
MPQNFDIAKDNERFQRLFERAKLAYLSIALISLITSTSIVLINNPIYMHDWRGIACIVLALVSCSVYVIPALLSDPGWPPPLYYSLSLWLGLYLATILLSFIDSTFIWNFYLALGMSSALFQSRRLLLAMGIIALTTFAFQGLLTWPLRGDALMGIVGQTMSFVSITAFCMVLQHMIHERYERNALLQQLAQTNTELEAAHRQLAQSVSQEQELAVLRERTRLAREMHDTLGHALVLISVKLEAAQRLRERDPERCERELESTKEIARDSMAALRASIANLRSPALEHEHIYNALGRAARELAQRTGLHITYTLQADLENLSELVVETLWKVSQETLTNIEKHAHASLVDLCISRHEGKILMSIHDNGVGLPPELYQIRKDESLVYTSPRGHYGLSGMIERVEGIGGRLSLQSSKEQGTTITIELPLSDINQLGDNRHTSLEVLNLAQNQ